MQSENYIPEKALANMPSSIPYEVLKALIPKMETQICKIECNNGGFGTGFFCNIPKGWDQTLKTLITNNHVLNKDDILIGKKIKFSLNNEKTFYEIEIDKSRKIYTNEKYDITIIEIKEYDKLNKISFFDIDEQIFDKDIKEIFKNAQIYLLHYPKGIRMEISNGLIKNINEDNYTIRHLCYSSGGSSGSPIINSIDFKVIGIHKGGAEGAKNYNLGTILKEPIEKFNEIDKMFTNEINNSKNEIIKINENIKKEMNENKKNEIDEKIKNEMDENKKNEIDENIKNEMNENKKNEINENIKNEMNENKKNEINENIKNENEDIDEIIIRYEIGDFQTSKFTNLFGQKFVKNNKDKCKIIIKGEEIELSSRLNIDKSQVDNNNILEVRLKGIKQITNLSDMFSWCPPFSVDMSKWNTENITDMTYMFYNCNKSLTLPDISNFNTQNVTKMDYMYANNIHLLSLPDISKWNTQNVTSMKSMFFNCSSLSSLPDISKWNTKNVTDMSYMFSGCSSLSSLPELSKWDTQKIKSKSGMFQDVKLNIPQKFK